MFVCKTFYFSIKSKWGSCWISSSFCRFFSFIPLNISCHSLLSCRVFAEKPTDYSMGIRLYVTFFFFFTAFNIFTFYLIVSLINMFIDRFFLASILYEICTSWMWVKISFPILGKLFTTISSCTFSAPFSSSLRTGLIWILVPLRI